MRSYYHILQDAFKQFILKVEGKKISIPYRINIPPVEHPARQGKSNPQVILKQLLEDAREQSFDLKNSSIAQIQDFMRQNNLGLDCSGFVYRMLDFLVQKVKGKSLTEFGFDHVGRTNVAILTDDHYSSKVELANIQPGDLIRMNGAGDLPHCVIILERSGDQITYAHSSRETNPEGVHQATAKIMDNQLEFKENLGRITYNIERGDSPKRLKALT